MHRILSRAWTITLLSGLLLSVAPGPAAACSCIVPDVEQFLEMHDFAFVGTLAEARPIGQGQFGGEALYTFSVEGWAKGNLGETVEVIAADNGAACGYEMPIGARAGIFLEKVDGKLRGSLCSVTDADQLAAAVDLQAPAAVESSGDPEPVTPAEPATRPVSLYVGIAAAAATLALGATALARRKA